MSSDKPAAGGTDSALEAVLWRRVPEWSPEADAVRGRVDSILAETLDYEEIARRALDAEWKNLSSAEQARILRMFAALTNQFVRLLSRDGFGELMERMQHKLEASGRY